ncbi:terminase large subunit [Antrihabitans cavernicola]|uniref:Terminase n=1 Tax=Antrihabitans cavernicola TaxID=2495913 RepID=A0A5A7S8L4_9NOCA|nr:terminase large subunit [Spelaeibacter cavernicola]KAA0021814.1 hypothetical protein FOY51_15535 [Spelaeibacter cavernicola]
MSSHNDLPVRGSQSPRLAVSCDYIGTFAEEAASFASAYGLIPDPWQLLVLEQWLGYRADGKWSASRCGLSVPRQNGKNALIEIRELFGMVGLGEKFLHTAHEVKTARKAFLRLASFFENTKKYPELAAMVKEIRRTNGQEAIVLRNGGSVEFVARSKGSARGFTVDVVVMDEAQQMDDDSLEALGPTTAAAPLKNRQLIWAGTPPAPGMPSEVFTRIRAEALDGNSRRLSWLEWSIDADSDLDDPHTWAQANPALGFRLGLEELAEDRATYSDEGFARERGGLWSFAGTDAVIDADTWDDVGDPASELLDPVSFAVDIAPDRGMASIAVSGVRPDGLYHVEVTENRKGTDWLIPRLTRLCAQWSPIAIVVDGPAASLVPELTTLGVPVYSTGVSEFGIACGMFYDAVFNQTLRHPEQPLFSSAIDAARKRPLGDMWAWGRKTSESDITPVVAATLALYGFVVARPKRRQKQGKRKVQVMM